jgi:hypothetical protein
MCKCAIRETDTYPGAGERVRAQANGRRSRGWVFARLVLALAAGGLMPAQGASESRLAAIDLAQGRTPQHHRASGLEERVRTLSKALDLDAKQQLELRKVLEKQREQVKKVWADESVPAPYRIAETQAVGDRAADAIRSLLNEEQRKKFSPPKPTHGATGTARSNVEDWMGAEKPK